MSKASAEKPTEHNSPPSDRNEETRKNPQPGPEVAVTRRTDVASDLELLPLHKGASGVDTLGKMKYSDIPGGAEMR